MFLFKKCIFLYKPIILMKKKLVTCTNCEQKFAEDFHFCPHCGQKSHEDLTLGVLFYNTISNYFSVDARFFKSFIPLLFKPGYLAKRFIEGKRLLYLHPAQFYLFISVVFFFLFSFIQREQQQQFDALLSTDFEKQLVPKNLDINKALDSVSIENIVNPIKENQKDLGIDDEDMQALDTLVTLKGANQTNMGSFDFKRQEIDSLIAIKAPNEEIYSAMGLSADASKLKRKFYAQILKFYKQRGGGILSAFYDTIPIALFILLPIFAFILKLLFFKTGSYAYHLVFSFYFFSFLFTVFSIVLLTNFIIDIPDWIDWLMVYSTFIYLFLAIKYFYNKGWIVSLFRTGLATFVYFTIVIPIAFVLIAISAFMFY